MTKTEIRTLMKPLRIRAARLPAHEYAKTGAALLENLRELAIWRTAQHPCIYASVPGEAPTEALLEDCFLREIAVLLPRVNGEELELREVRGMDALVPGAFGIREPGGATRVATPTETDCVLIPGVAFDATGGRVGRGRGFYDRLLARIPNVPRIALAWEWQLLEQVPVDSRDAKMDWLITPERILRCGCP
jgi:5-formyltetrahydrofolate cyclo-ligase